MIGERRHLRQMGDAQHLVRCRQPPQPPAHRFRNAAADARIHFIEHALRRGQIVIGLRGER
jgi:hypothetical protein